MRNAGVLEVLEKQLSTKEILKWSPLRFAEETHAWGWVEILLQGGLPRKHLEVTRAKLSDPEHAAGIMEQLCECGHLQLLQFALSVDPALANVTLQGGGRSPLQVAAARRRDAAVRLLVEAGADVGARDGRGRTALHAAVAHGAVDATRILLHAGADAWARDADGRTARELARRNEQVATVQVLEELAGDVHWPLRRLILAAEASNVAAVRQLLAARRGPPKGRWTHLHWASLKGSATVVRTLVAAGMDPDARDRHGNTPLHAAAARGRPEVVQALVEAGATLDAADATGSTALHYAVRTGNVAAARLLLAAGADTEVRDGDGDTALHRAVSRGSLDAVSALLHAGARRDAADADGRTPYDVARLFGYTDMLRFLRLSP
ncbi:ankyrin homolog [Schistocerca americana]|uniref:ankyrin homolog n=1 Tax=Schistocerca americana TaxID=7009 RepID=UPI001F4F42A1|nr:ankyrin homolog [Schistocerca americana]